MKASAASKGAPQAICVALNSISTPVKAPDNQAKHHLRHQEGPPNRRAGWRAHWSFQSQL